MLQSERKEDRAQCRRDVSFATQMCRRAVNSLFEASGGSNVYRRSKLQRLWRDSDVAGAHHGLMWDIHGLAYAALPPACRLRSSR